MNGLELEPKETSEAYQRQSQQCAISADKQKKTKPFYSEQSKLAIDIKNKDNLV